MPYLHLKTKQTQANKSIDIIIALQRNKNIIYHMNKTIKFKNIKKSYLLLILKQKQTYAIKKYLY